jgi:hypothetical protein
MQLDDRGERLDKPWPEPLEDIRPDPLKEQEGGDHYKGFNIQPVEFCQMNEVNYCEGNAIKYVMRHRSKGGAADLKKAIHYIEMLIAMEYP